MVFVQVFGFRTESWHLYRHISFHNVYQTICRHWIILYDHVVNGLPEFQAFVLRESQINPINCIVCWSPLKCMRIFCRFVFFASRSEHCCHQGDQLLQRSMFVVFSSNSESSRNETSITNGSVNIRWSPVIHVIWPSMKNHHIALQSWIDSFSSWVTRNRSHVLDLTVFVETIFKPSVVGPVFQTCSGPTGCPFESFAFIHQSFPGKDPSRSRCFGECLNTFTTLDEFSNDPEESSHTQGIYLHFQFSIGMVSCTSREEFLQKSLVCTA